MRTLADISGHGMSIKIADPPNIAEIAKVFPIVRERWSKGIYFCYGDTIYNPSGRVIPMELIAHECVHSLQQRDAGVEKWWTNYIVSPQYRFRQELEAHRVEYASIVDQGHSRALRRRYLAGISERLAGPLYGNMVRKAEAKRLITEV
jgi:hypothetical protein